MCAEVTKMLHKDSTHPADKERKALFFILGNIPKFTREQNKIYDFDDHSIKPEYLDSGLSSGEKKIIQLAFNLYNSWNGCPSPCDLFASFGDNFTKIALEAIRIRFNVP